MAEPEEDFHPDDPTADTWRKLLAKSARPNSHHAQSAEARLKKSRANKEYFEKNPGDAQGYQLPKAETRPVLGTCALCDTDFRQKSLVSVGLCQTCLRKALESGSIEVRDGKYVIVKKLKRKKK